MPGGCRRRSQHKLPVKQTKTVKPVEILETSVATVEHVMSKNPTLCLTMIVRNEGPRMPRLLESVRGLIDEVVISDTGSTDDTIAVTISKCEEMGVRCIIDTTPFRDFGFNRSRSITVAVKKSVCDYLLFLDADMKLVVGPTFSKSALLEKGIDILSLMQRGCGLEYYNMRIMRRSLLNLRCVGVTHEHYASDGPHTSYNVPGDQLFIDDIGDGGSKADKFPRDQKLLTRGLIDEPTNVRYMFYLAETCRHSHKFEESIKYYKRRIKAGGWDEEIYRSMYGISMCYMSSGNADKADAYAIRAHLFRPTRIESLYCACKWHRERGENAKAYAFYLLGSRIARPLGDVLFVETAPYNYAWDYEFAILAYYLERTSAGSKTNHLTEPIGTAACLRRILTSLGTAASRDSRIPGSAFDNMVDNIKHYVELLPTSYQRTDMNTSLVSGMTSSTPNVVRLSGYADLVRLVRHVDYKINHDDGSYRYGSSNTVSSAYTFKKSDSDSWKTLTVDTTKLVEWKDTRIKDVEDLRLFNLAPTTGRLDSSFGFEPVVLTGTLKDENRVYAVGTTVQWSTDGCLTMMLLEVDMNSLVAKPIKLLNRLSGCEKNHAPISGTNLCVYSWGPRFKVYDLVKSTAQSLEITHDFEESKVPGWFRNLRGSSCGIGFPSFGPPREFWFICHTVVHTSPRRYMHTLVRLDSTSLAVVGYSIPFSFDDYHVEFVGGITFDEDDSTLVIGYSVFDSSSREIRIPVSRLIISMITP